MGDSKPKKKIMVSLELVHDLTWSQEFGAKLRRIRETAREGGKIKQQEVSDLLEQKGFTLNPRQVRRLENGETESINTQKLEAILEILGSDMAELLGDEWNVTLISKG